MKLGGWRRLWLAVSILWGVLVLVLAAMDFPTDAQHRHSDKIYARMTPDTLAKLDARDMVYIGGVGSVPRDDGERFALRSRAINPAERLEDWNAANQRLWQELVNAGQVSPLTEESVLRMANGHVIRFTAGTTDAEKAKVAGEYQRALDDDVAAERRATMWAAVLWWFVPIVVLYVLGRTVGWVRAGFNQDGRAL